MQHIWPIVQCHGRLKTGPYHILKWPRVMRQKNGILFHAVLGKLHETHYGITFLPFIENNMTWPTFILTLDFTRKKLYYHHLPARPNVSTASNIWKDGGRYWTDKNKCRTKMSQKPFFSQKNSETTLLSKIQTSPFHNCFKRPPAFIFIFIFRLPASSHHYHLQTQKVKGIVEETKWWPDWSTQLLLLAPAETVQKTNIFYGGGGPMLCCLSNGKPLLWVLLRNLFLAEIQWKLPHPIPFSLRARKVNFEKPFVHSCILNMLIALQHFM